MYVNYFDLLISKIKKNNHTLYYNTDLAKDKDETIVKKEWPFQLNIKNLVNILILI